MAVLVAVCGKPQLMRVVLLLNFCAAVVYSSHFRGGVIMVKPKPGGTAREIEISYHVSWRRNRDGHLCDATTVANSDLFNGDDYSSLNCQYGCSDTISSRMPYVCTHYSIEDNWSFGENNITHKFNQVSDENTITIGHRNDGVLDELGGGKFNVSTTFSLIKRADTGKINSSPRVLPTLPLHLLQGCSYTIPLPVSDPDNDIIRCRWAVGRECISICSQFPGAVLDPLTCTITYTANRGTGLKGGVIMIEDYAHGSLHRPLSSVTLQFLILVVASAQPYACSIETELSPMILHPSNKTIPWLYDNPELVNVTLTCMANETLSYYWERQNDDIPYNSIGIHTNTLTLINAHPKDAGNYRCVAFNYSVCCRSYSDYATVSIINVTSPMFVSYPTPQHVNLTETAIFTCSAIGYNVSYQWTTASGSFPDKVIDINSNTLVIPDVRSSDDNTYTCVASNEGGNASSNATQLTVTGLPMVTVTSSAESAEVTHNVTFTAAVTGVGPFNYQWQAENNNITNETGSTFIIYNVSHSDQTNYSCYVSNNYGDSVVSNYISLQVTRNLPVITKDPTSTLVYLESNFTNVTLTCEADGASSYHWQRQHNSIPSSAIGININVLTLINVQLKDAGYYQCIAINASGNTKSKYAELTFKVSPSKIVTQPTNTSAAAPFGGVFTCSVEGYGYQHIIWHKQSGVLPHKHKTSKIASGTIVTSTLIIPNITQEDAGKYYCQVWAFNNVGVRSEKADLYYSGIPSKPEIVVQPGQVINLTVNNLNLSMQCGHYNSDLDYQWEKKNEKAHSKLHDQEINSYQLTISNLKPDDSGEYRCAISNFTGMMFSDYMLVSIKVVLPVILKQPKSVVVEANHVATFECTARSYGVVSIAWKSLNSEMPITANVAVTKSLNEITSILRIDRTIGYYEGYYYCVIENSVGQVNSSFAYCNVTVPCPEMIISPKPVVVHLDAMVTFLCLAWSYGELLYKWERNDSSILPSNSTYGGRDDTIHSLSILNVQVMDEGHYCCVASNECGSITRCAWLEVDTRATITIQPKPIALKCKNRNIQALWIAASAVGPIFYQWQKYDRFANSWISPSSRAVNVTSPNLTFSVITEEDQGTYHCVVANDDGSIVSDEVNITVYGKPKITYCSTKIAASEGDKANMICNATNDKDSIDPVQIRWFNGTELLKPDGKHVIIHNKYDNISDSAYSALLLDPVNRNDDGEYRCQAFTYSFCYVESSLNLTVEYAPRIIIYPPQSPYTVDAGTTLVLHCIAEGYPVPTIQWYKNDIPIPQESSRLYLADTDVPGTAVYTCEGKNSAGKVENTVRANITVIVKNIEKCPLLSDPDNGKVYIILDGRVAIITCNSNFVITGNSYLQCINGKWSSPVPKCLVP